MKKKGIELSLSSLIGLVVGIALTVGIIIFVIIPFWNVFINDMHSEDEALLEDSMEELESLIIGINNGEEKDMLFYSYDQMDLYLNAYNNDSDVNRCFLVPCIVICNDELCDEEVLFDKTFSSDIVFENTGIITKVDIEEGNSGRFLLYVKKRNGSISLSLS